MPLPADPPPPRSNDTSVPPSTQPRQPLLTHTPPPDPFFLLSPCLRQLPCPPSPPARRHSQHLCPPPLTLPQAASPPPPLPCTAPGHPQHLSPQQQADRMAAPLCAGLWLHGRRLVVSAKGGGGACHYARWAELTKAAIRRKTCGLGVACTKTAAAHLLIFFCNMPSTCNIYGIIQYRILIPT